MKLLKKIDLNAKGFEEVEWLKNYYVLQWSDAPEVDPIYYKQGQAIKRTVDWEWYRERDQYLEVRTDHYLQMRNAFLKDNKLLEEQEKEALILDERE